MFKRHGGQRPNIVGGLFGWLWLAAAIVPIST